MASEKEVIGVIDGIVAHGKQIQTTFVVGKEYYKSLTTEGQRLMDQAVELGLVSREEYWVLTPEGLKKVLEKRKRR